MLKDGYLHSLVIAFMYLEGKGARCKYFAVQLWFTTTLGWFLAFSTISLKGAVRDLERGERWVGAWRGYACNYFQKFSFIVSLFLGVFQLIARYFFVNSELLANQICIAITMLLLEKKSFMGNTYFKSVTVKQNLTCEKLRSQDHIWNN